MGYHEEGRSSSLWMVTSSGDSEASGVRGDGERESEAVFDVVDIVEMVEPDVDCDELQVKVVGNTKELLRTCCL